MFRKVSPEQWEQEQEQEQQQQFYKPLDRDAHGENSGAWGGLVIF